MCMYVCMKEEEGRKEGRKKKKEGRKELKEGETCLKEGSYTHVFARYKASFESDRMMIFEAVRKDTKQRNKGATGGFADINRNVRRAFRKGW